MELKMRYWRKKRGLSLQEVAAASGYDYTQISKWENGVKHPRTDQLEAIAKVLAVPPRDLMPIPYRIPVVGYVGGGQEVFGIEDNPPGSGLYFVECPEGLDPATAVGLEVRGSSMLPIEDKWIVIYQKTQHWGESDFLGRLCVVKTKDGHHYVKRVRKGYLADRYNLVSTNADPMDDVELDWAAPVVRFLAPDQVIKFDEITALEIAP